MVLYLLKSAACLTLFFLFYKGLLENVKMHQFKRFYLLGSLVLSFVIPGIVFVQYVDAPAVEIIQTPTSFSESISSIPNPQKAISDWDTINFSLLAWSFYSLGVFLFSIRFVRNLTDIVLRIRRNQKIKEVSHVKVLIHEKLPPHTFLNYVFLESEKFKSNSFAPEVLLHEETHAKQRHTYDILFVELLQVIFWFNPLIYLFKHSIKLNHEFLADDSVLRKLDSTKKYQNTLLSYLSAESQLEYQSVKMASSIHYSSIKKRFTIMKKQTSNRAKLIRALLILPLVSMLLWSFSETQYIPKLPDTSLDLFNNIQQDEISIKIKEGQIEVNGKEVTLKDFANTLDAITEGWEETDYTSFRPNIHIQNTSKARRLQIDKEFKKTHLSKANGGMSIIPPKPPAPPAPPTPIKAGKGEIGLDTPPSPPEPESPLEHIVAMAKKGADFYYENQKISSDKAIELIKGNEHLHIQTKGHNSSKPNVKISKNPITVSKT